MSRGIDPFVRIALLCVGTGIVGILSWTFTGSIVPTEPTDSIIFQTALLLIVLSSSLLERHYTKPADSLVNSLIGLMSLLSVYGEAPDGPWLCVVIYCSSVLVLSVICVSASAGRDVHPARRWLADATYRPAITFGRARVLFSIVFIFSLLSFYSLQSPITITLILFWGTYIAMWPLHIPQLLTSFTRSRDTGASVTGEILRIDDPGILRIRLGARTSWDPSKPQICVLPDGVSRWVQPLYSQFQEGHRLATGLLTTIPASPSIKNGNCILESSQSDSPPSIREINAALGGGENSELVGFVIEKSQIGAIEFETLGHAQCYEGMLVWCQLDGELIYYQIVAGETREESFAADKHGFRVASAVQLGKLEPSNGFCKFEWLPPMNTPIFSSPTGQSVDSIAVQDSDFVLGTIPKTNIRVGGAFTEDCHHHTAILGVTGSGKTELTFDIIRHALSRGVKVVCIDLTDQYGARLSDLDPVNLAIDSATASKLENMLFAVETGQYGAGAEKQSLATFATTLRSDITARIETFLDESQKQCLGLIRLEEISNTKATLWITEIFMACILKYARENIGKCPGILIVVEEAHTVMPEASTMGLGDFDSKGLVGKISQIALQGRKFGVGLLVVAQRTATVSKTVLTQCNTIISFSCYDDTSLGFLRNIFGPNHIALIPNLPRLHAVAYGPWVRSQQPIVFEIPFDSQKAPKKS